MTISIIAAVGKNMELGKKNSLIWHLPDDLKFFKETTMGKTVIMGRKTFESLPKALPGRKNIVISSDKDLKLEGAAVVNSLEDGLNLSDTDEMFVIGGESIYKAFLNMADKIYLTEIDAADDCADVFFPEFDRKQYSAEVLKENENNGIKFKHILYQKK